MSTTKGKYLVLEDRVNISYAEKLFGAVVTDPHCPHASIVLQSPSSLDPADTSGRKNYKRTLEWESRLGGSLLSTVGLKMEKATSKRLKIESKFVKKMELPNPGVLLSEILQNERAMRMLEKKVNIEGKLYLVTGIQTCVDGVFAGSTVESRVSTLQLHITDSIKGKGDLNRTDRKATDWQEEGVGEEIFAIRYSLIQKQRRLPFGRGDPMTCTGPPRFAGSAMLGLEPGMVEAFPRSRGESMQLVDSTDIGDLSAGTPQFTPPEFLGIGSDSVRSVPRMKEESMELVDMDFGDFEEWDAMEPVEDGEFVLYVPAEDGGNLS